MTDQPKIIFTQTYDGESLYDLERDMAEAIDANYNPLAKAIPVDEHGIQQGVFKVTIEWTP